jgi:hypothetical protein
MTDNEFRESWNFSKMVAINIGSVTLSKEDVLAIDDFINRQKAEIERLEHIRAELSKEADRIAEEHSDLIVEKDELFDIAENALKGMREANALFPKVQAKARAQAVKEFAEGLHKYINEFRERREMVMLPYTEAALLAIERKIDNLVKEFAEGGDTE